MRCLSDRGGTGQLRSYWEQQVHVAVGQTGNPPVFEVRPEGRTGKPRVLHLNILLPFDHPHPSANQSHGKVPSSSPRKVPERLQKDKFGTRDSVDEDDSSGLSLIEFETLQLCTPTGDTERRTERKAEVTNETMTEEKTYHPCSASSIQIATENSVPGQIMYCLPCPPWVITTLSYYGSANLHWGPSQYGPVHSRAVAGYPIHVSVDASSSLLRITCTT